MNLDELQRVFHAVLTEGVDVEAGAAALGVDARRLAIYRRFVKTHVRTALDANFTVLSGVLGPAAWGDLADGYRSAYPPVHWELNAAAQHFVTYLGERFEAGHVGLEAWHGALAELEWALFEVGVETQWPFARGSALGMNPSVVVLEQAFPVAAFAAAWLRGEPRPAPVAGVSRTLVFLKPATGRAAFLVADDELLFALKVVSDGMTAVDAAAAVGVSVDLVERVLARAIGVGIVLEGARE